VIDDAALAERYGLTPEQFADARTVSEMTWVPGMSNRLLSYFLKYPEPTWRRVINATIDLKRRSL